jgi:hypothetical protein
MIEAGFRKPAVRKKLNRLQKAEKLGMQMTKQSAARFKTCSRGSITARPMRDPSPSRAARRRARDRRYRARVALCARLAPVEYDGDTLDFLVDTNWLSEHETSDKRRRMAAEIPRFSECS